MDYAPKSEPPKILGTAKLLSKQLITKYEQRESEGIARILVEYITNKPYKWLIIDPEATFTISQFADWQVAAERILGGEPIQYVIGRAWFRDLELFVAPGVLIPRPETELLVDLIIEAEKKILNPKIIDIGTGSGCIALSLSQEIPNSSVFAVDYSVQALAIAKRNALELDLPIKFIHLDILQVERDQFSDFDCIVCNPPYIPESESKEMENHVVAFEPSSALFVPDEDPLLFYNKVSWLGTHWLKPGGWLFFEIHCDFGEQVVNLMQALGYIQIELHQDLSGRDRIVAGKRPH